MVFRAVSDRDNRIDVISASWAVFFFRLLGTGAGCSSSSTPGVGSVQVGQDVGAVLKGVVQGQVAAMAVGVQVDLLIEESSVSILQFLDLGQDLHLAKQIQCEEAYDEESSSHRRLHVPTVFAAKP